MDRGLRPGQGRRHRRSDPDRAGPHAPRPALDVHLPATPAALLFRLDALLDDHDPFAIEERGGEPHPSSAIERRVYFFSAERREDACRAIERALAPHGARATPIDVPDDGWAARSQGSLRGLRIGDLVVAPPWDAPASAAPSETVVVIEPSTGFGTGHHASTRMCLLALQRVRGRLRASRRVLDLGTGSGVLAIAAARLGGAAVVAVERDRDALDNARRNVRRNRVAARVTLLAGDLAELSLDAADVVTANLAGALFVRHAAAVLRAVRPGGLLLAGGITAGEEQAVRAALEPPLALRERTAEDEWVGLVLERPPPNVTPRSRDR